MVLLICPICDKMFNRTPSAIKISYERGSKKLYCSQSCMGKDPDRKERAKKLGSSNNWSKGLRLKNRPGFSITSRGHKIIYKPEHPFSSKKGYIMEHRLVMELHLGRYLKPEEKVHHINANKLDNRIKNLHLCKNQSEHISKHKDKKTGKFTSKHLIHTP